MRECVYCGRTGVKWSKEHIVPEAIGGSLKIRRVCQQCNNTTLSEVDKELCSNSPLSVALARYDSSRLKNHWDVDHTANNLLVEARFDAAAGGMHAFPQIIFDSAGKHLRGDMTEIESVGLREFQRRFFDCVLSGFKAFENGDKRALIFEQIERGFIPSTFRLPPRVFVPYAISELTTTSTPIVRYEYRKDRRVVLRELSGWTPDRYFSNLDARRGSEKSNLQVLFEPTRTLRGLMKIALNLLIHVCKHTPIDRATFGIPIGVVRGELEIPDRLLCENGFVLPESLNGMRGIENTHLFWIIYQEGFWHVYAAYFGGLIFSKVSLPGPSSEDWNFLEVEVPLTGDKGKWKILARRVIPHLRPQIEWTDVSLLIPDAAIRTVEKGHYLVPKKRQRG